MFRAVLAKRRGKAAEAAWLKRSGLRRDDEILLTILYECSPPRGRRQGVEIFFHLVNVRPFSYHIFILCGSLAMAQGTLFPAFCRVKAGDLP